MSIREVAWCLPIYAPEIDGKKFRVDPSGTGAGWVEVTLMSGGARPFGTLYNYKDASTPATAPHVSLAALLASEAAVVLGDPVLISYIGATLQGQIQWVSPAHATQWQLDVGTTVTPANDVIDATLFGLSPTGGGGSGIYLSTGVNKLIEAERQAERIWLPRRPVAIDLEWDTDIVGIAEPMTDKDETIVNKLGSFNERHVMVEMIIAPLIHNKYNNDPDYAAKVDGLVTGDNEVTLQTFRANLNNLIDQTTRKVPLVKFIFDWPSQVDSDNVEDWVITDAAMLATHKNWVTEISRGPLYYNVDVRGFRV